MGARLWSQEEIDYLYEAWGTVSVKRIISHLKRKYNRIINLKGLVSKVKRLGYEPITKIAGNWLSPGDVGLMLGIPHRTMYTWAAANKIPFEQITLKTKQKYLISYSDLIKWLENNKHMWNATKVELYALGVEPEWLIEKRKYDRNNFKQVIPKKKQIKKLYDIATLKEIAQKHKKGIPAKELSKIYYISASTIYRYIKLVG